MTSIRLAADSRQGHPRVLMPTLRRINTHAAWCSNYEFEDVIRAVDDVQLLELEAGSYQPARQRLARSLAWRGRHSAFTRLNPGLKKSVVDRDYDLFVFVVMNVWDLLYLNSIQDWQTRCRVKICYMVEFYAGQASELEPLLRILSRFDFVFQSFSSSVPAVSRTIGKVCHHAALAADVKRFTPQPKPPKRVIDVYSIGGRAPRVHEALLKMARSRDLFYVHDTVPGTLVRPSNAVEHREMYASIAKRSRFFIAYEAKFGNSENQGQSEIGARYFEGTAAGAVLLGRSPTVSAFREHFPWPDPVVEINVDGSDVSAVLENLLGRSDAIEQLGKRNASHALRNHDWGHRWLSILQAVRVDPLPALEDRLESLRALADQSSPS